LVVGCGRIGMGGSKIEVSANRQQEAGNRRAKNQRRAGDRVALAGSKESTWRFDLGLGCYPTLPSWLRLRGVVELGGTDSALEVIAIGGGEGPTPLSKSAFLFQGSRLANLVRWGGDIDMRTGRAMPSGAASTAAAFLLLLATLLRQAPASAFVTPSTARRAVGRHHDGGLTRGDGGSPSRLRSSDPAQIDGPLSILTKSRESDRSNDLMLGEDAGAYDFDDESWGELGESGWLTFFAAVATILTAVAVLWIYPPTGYGDDFVNFLENDVAHGNPHLVTLAFGIIFPIVHSGLASLRPLGGEDRRRPGSGG
ncbi:hypothetical protein THAOC_20689, partial [Thalassiosira oceanica]